MIRKISTLNLILPLLLTTFINICLLYLVVYQGGNIYANHVSEVASDFETQAKFYEVLTGIVNSVSDETHTNTSAIRDHIEIINQHAGIINDHIDVLTNHAEVQNAQTKLLMDQNTGIQQHAKRLKRLEAIVNNLQKKLGYDKSRPKPETEA